MFIREIFESIQGEGNFLGLPCIFVRTQGCNLKCEFCDTKETWGADAEHVIDMSPIQVVGAVQMIAEGNISLVVITGGEPCIQKDIQEVVDQLIVAGFTVSMETNGTQETPAGINWVTASPKPDANYNISPACRPNELKYVITEDFDDRLIISEGIRSAYAGKIWLQPDGYNMQAMWKKCYDIAMADPRLRVGVQLHKLMEVK